MRTTDHLARRQRSRRRADLAGRRDFVPPDFGFLGAALGLFGAALGLLGAALGFVPPGLAVARAGFVAGLRGRFGGGERRRPAINGSLA